MKSLAIILLLSFAWLPSAFSQSDNELSRQCYEYNINDPKNYSNPEHIGVSPKLLKTPCKDSAAKATEDNSKLEFLLAACVRENECDELLDYKTNSCKNNEETDEDKSELNDCDKVSIFNEAVAHLMFYLKGHLADYYYVSENGKRNKIYYDRNFIALLHKSEYLKINYFMLICKGDYSRLPVPISNYFNNAKLDLGLISPRHRKVENSELTGESEFQHRACREFSSYKPRNS